MRPFLITTGVLVTCLAAACASDVVSLGPTPAGEGIVIYLHADFAGPSQSLNVDVPDLGKVEGACSGGDEGETPSWSDCVSSVKVMPGWTATLYRDKNYKGASVAVTADAPSLRDLRGPCDKDSFNDCVSSIRVARQ
jgi:Peptidase inhibitor family I36